MNRSTPVTHDRRPPWTGTVTALGGSLLVVGLVAASPLSVATSVFGTLCLGVGLWRVEYEPVTLGVAALFGAVLYVGLGRPPLWLLSATVPVILVWGAARHAVRLGRQVGRTGKTVRVELVQSVSTFVVVVLAGGLGYLTFQSVSGTVSLLGVVLLLGSVVTVTLVLR